MEKERKRVHYTTLKAEATPYGKTLPMSEGLVKVIGLGAHRVRVRFRVRVRVRRASSRPPCHPTLTLSPNPKP